MQEEGIDREIELYGCVQMYAGIVSCGQMRQITRDLLETTKMLRESFNKGKLLFMNYAVSKWIAVALAVSYALTGIAHAEVKTITVTHSYVLGDNDSRNDARKLCFLEAKRKILEKAGSYIQSQTEVENLQLSKDKISSYSAAVLSVEIVKEDFGGSNGQNTLTLTVQAKVDMADVMKRLQEIAADKNLQNRISEQQQQIRRLEEKVLQLNEHVNAASVSSAGELRKERNVVFGNLQELENKKLAAIKAIAEKTEIIRRYIVKGMTFGEVHDILGSPRSSVNPEMVNGQCCFAIWNYGELWIVFDNGLVYCTTRDRHRC